MNRKQRRAFAKAQPSRSGQPPGFVWYSVEGNGPVQATTRPSNSPPLNTAKVSALGDRTMRAIHADLAAKNIPVIIEQDPYDDLGALRVVIPGQMTITMDWWKSRALHRAFLLVETDGDTFAVSATDMRRDLLDHLVPQ